MIGEGCHFVDLLSFLCGDAEILSVDSLSVGPERGVAQDFGVQLGFADGSVGQILYASCGDPALGKERIEVHGGGASAVIEDFHRCRVVTGGKARNAGKPGKGHKEEIRTLMDAVRRGGPSPIDLGLLLAVTRATFRAHRLLSGSDGGQTCPET